MKKVESIETMTTDEVAQILGKGTEFVRATLRQNKVNWGWAVQNEKGRWNYIIIKTKFLEYMKGKINEKVS